MAFKVASGYQNLPNGNFSPVIYSQKVQQAFRKSSVAESITNNDYFGEIANFGDTVRIIKEPEITVKAYSRGTTVTPQDLDDEDFNLVIDKANYFALRWMILKRLTAMSISWTLQLAVLPIVWQTTMTKKFLRICQATSSPLCTAKVIPLTQLLMVLRL